MGVGVGSFLSLRSTSRISDSGQTRTIPALPQNVWRRAEGGPKPQKRRHSDLNVGNWGTSGRTRSPFGRSASSHYRKFDGKQKSYKLPEICRDLDWQGADTIGVAVAALLVAGYGFGFVMHRMQAFCAKRRPLGSIGVPIREGRQQQSLQHTPDRAFVAPSLLELRASGPYSIVNPRSSSSAHA